MSEEMTKCPYCNEMIIVGARKCRYCGEILDPTMRVASPIRKRSIYILLGILLGEFGVNDFYAGYIGRGIAKLLITIFLGPLYGIGILITVIWSICEVCVITTDAQGNKLQ